MWRFTQAYELFFLLHTSSKLLWITFKSERSRFYRQIYSSSSNCIVFYGISTSKHIWSFPKGVSWNKLSTLKSFSVFWNKFYYLDMESLSVVKSINEYLSTQIQFKWSIWATWRLSNKFEKIMFLSGSINLVCMYDWGPFFICRNRNVWA